MLTSEGNPDPKKFPSYMVQESDNFRSEISRQILEANKKFSFDDWRRAAFDTRVLGADKHLPQLLGVLKSSSMPTRNSARHTSVLSSWDHRSSTTSVGMTLFTLWVDRLEDANVTPTDEAAGVTSL